MNDSYTKENIFTHMVSQWKELLDVDEIEQIDDFFALGGDSFLAAKLLEIINSTYQIDVSLPVFFKNSTVVKLVGYIHKLVCQPNNYHLPSLEKIKRAAYPLSFYQFPLLLDEYLYPDHNYMMTFALAFSGTINRNFLKRAICLMMERHKILTTKFVLMEEEFHQQEDPEINTSVLNKQFQFITTDKPVEGSRVFLEDSWKGNRSVESLELFKVTFFGEEKTNTSPLIVAVRVHHTIFDDTSLNIFVRELALIYQAFLRNDSPKLPVLGFQYHDFSFWQRNQLAKSKLFLEDQTYWKKNLSHFSETLSLPYDYTIKKGTTQIECEQMVLEHTLVEECTQLSNKLSASRFIIYLSVFVVLLYKYTQQQDFCIGIPVTNRQLPGTENLIGLFVNVLTLRFTFEGDLTITELIAYVKKVFIGALEHQNSPSTSSYRSHSNNLKQGPVYNVMFVLQNMSNPLLQFEEFEINICSTLRSKEPFDLTLSLEEMERSMLSIKYNANLFFSNSIKRMLLYFKNILKTFHKLQLQD